MRKSVVAVTLFIVTVFSAGYLLGQVLGITPSSAATTTTPTPTTTQPGIGSVFGPMHADTPHADGTVTAVNGNTITIKADADIGNPNEYKNVTTVQLTSSTQKDVDPDGSSSTSTITVGSYLIAEGTLSADGKTLTATSIHVLPAGAAHGGPPAQGTGGLSQFSPGA
jgi:hypothetical protein